jgi:hypothetical protein
MSDKQSVRLPDANPSSQTNSAAQTNTAVQINSATETPLTGTTEGTTTTTSIPTGPPEVSLASSSGVVPASSSNLTTLTTQSTPNNTAITAPVGETSSATQVPHKNGAGPGAVAGAAIGCLLAGILVASLVFFLFFRRYKARQQPPPDYTHHLGPQSGHVDAQTGSRSQFKDNAAVSVVEKYLPQPAEDDAISGEMSKLRDRIKNHAQSYYHTATVDPALVGEANLQALSEATGMTTVALKECLLDPKTRLAAIRLWISWVILSRFGGNRGRSLLPPEVTGFTELAVEPQHTDPGSSSLSPIAKVISNDHAGRIALMSKWKSMSGAILQPRYNTQATDSDPRNHRIEQCLAEMDAVLQPFVGSSPEASQRLRNLESTVRRAAQFALLLFSQPSFWGFGWLAPRGGIVVFPALLQMVNDELQILSPPRAFTQAEIAEGN